MKQHITKLIDIDVEQSRAKNLLLQLVNHKINYHQLENFSNEIRFGKNADHSEAVIEELIKEKQDLSAWLNALQQNDKIKIHCNIELQIVE
jgi:hypothetical protein